jgi:hypothetical protein
MQSSRCQQHPHNPLLRPPLLLVHRYMPLQQHQQPPLEQQQQPASSFVIATKSVSAEVYVFDTRHYANQADGDTPLEQECRPDLRLTGVTPHTQ